MSWLSKWLHGNSNPADSAMPYLNNIPGQTAPYHQPYYNAGVNSIPTLQQNYDKLLSNPGEFMNHMGESYKQSPGFKFALDQALGASGRASAAGGMAGSPMHEQQNMQLANDMASKDYNDWLSNALNLYGAGLHGTEGMADRGQKAGQSMADTIAQTLAQQANLSFRGEQEKNAQNNSFFKGLGQLGGAGAGALLGGPWGAFAGWKMMS